MRFPLREPERAFDFEGLVDFAELCVLAEDCANEEPEQNKQKDKKTAAQRALLFMDRIENTIRDLPRKMPEAYPNRNQASFARLDGRERPSLRPFRAGT